MMKRDYKHLIELARENGAWQQCSFTSYLTDVELQELESLLEKAKQGVASPWDMQRIADLVDAAKWREARDAPGES